MALLSVDLVDAFLAEYKTLDGFFPAWARRGPEWTSRWPILNSLGAAEGVLAFTIDGAITHPTISVLYRSYLVYRLDIVPAGECKPNPLGAFALGLPRQVCGPHTHPWSMNRDWVMANDFGELPYRQPITLADPSFIRGLEWAGAELNINISPSQRDIDMPAATLFDARSR
jgi:hypothetical protein